MTIDLEKLEAALRHTYKCEPYEQSSYIREIHDAAMAYLEQQRAKVDQVPDGWVLVPVEPTDAMSDKGEYVNSEWLNDNAPIGQNRYKRPAQAVYKAMIAAAPKPTGDV